RPRQAGLRREGGGWTDDPDRRSDRARAVDQPGLVGAGAVPPTSAVTEEPRSPLETPHPSTVVGSTSAPATAGARTFEGPLTAAFEAGAAFHVSSFEGYGRGAAPATLLLPVPAPWPQPGAAGPRTDASRRLVGRLLPSGW